MLKEQRLLLLSDLELSKQLSEESYIIYILGSRFIFEIIK